MRKYWLSQHLPTSRHWITVDVWDLEVWVSGYFSLHVHCNHAHFPSSYSHKKRNKKTPHKTHMVCSISNSEKTGSHFCIFLSLMNVSLLHILSEPSQIFSWKTHTNALLPQDWASEVLQTDKKYSVLKEAQVSGSCWGKSFILGKLRGLFHS